MKNFQKGLANVWWIVIVAVVLIIAGYFAFIRNKSSQNKQVISASTTSQTILNFGTTTTSTGMYKTYFNDNLHISFDYPSSWGNSALVTAHVDFSKCQDDGMKTYMPDYYRPTDKITFSNRNPNYLYVNLVSFSQSNPSGCDDGGVINLIEKRNEFVKQPLRIEEEANGWKTGVSKNDQGNIFTYYPDYYDSIGTSIDQIYDMFGPNLLVQAWILYNPSSGSPEAQEAHIYDCISNQKYGTCGLTEWLRLGKTSKGLREDFNGLDHLVKTFKFI